MVIMGFAAWSFVRAEMDEVNGIPCVGFVFNLVAIILCIFLVALNAWQFFIYPTTGQVIVRNF